MISATFLLIAIMAGVLTVLAPCILPLLPVVIGSSAQGRSRYTPYIVIGSLGLSILVFTYLLKASTLFIDIPTSVWSTISGVILVGFGLILAFPKLWDMVPGVQKVSTAGNKLVGTGHQKKSFWGDVMIGAALGPVFSSCSPTYFVILAAVLPESFLVGTVYLLAYILGLSIVLLAIAILGQKIMGRLLNLADDSGWFKKTIGVLFIVIGIAIILGLDKTFETAVLNSGLLDGVIEFENAILEENTNF
jgi:cytochrome c-type biogenesis protein